MKTKTKIGLTLGLLSLLALGGLTQSKYVRNATIEMDVTSETDPGVFLVNNTLEGNAGLPWTTYTIPKTGYYALQLRGGDGGTNLDAKGGKGGVVEAVYYLVKDQQIQYTLGGRGGWYEMGSQNGTNGKSSYANGGTGGGGSTPQREGSGGGGASAVRLNGDALLVAGGGGGGGGAPSNKPSMAGVGGSNVDVDGYGASNHPNLAGTISAINIDRRRTDSGANLNGQGYSIINPNGGGGSDGGYGTSFVGGQFGTNGGTGKGYAGAGTGGHSYVNPTVNSVGFIALTRVLKATYATKLPTSGGDFIPFPTSTNTGGSTSTAGQFRIAYLWSDTTADHTAIDNIYK